MFRDLLCHGKKSTILLFISIFRTTTAVSGTLTYFYIFLLFHFKSPKCIILDQPDVKDTLHKLHANYVLVPADKAVNNVIIVCKKYYIDTLVKELK